jgi:hypothetical protein
MYCVLICFFLKFQFIFFLCLHIIISVEQSVRQIINNGHSVSDVLFLVYLLSQCLCNILRLTITF